MDPSALRYDPEGKHYARRGGRRRGARQPPGSWHEDGERAMLHGLINRLRELTGIYGTGFERASVVGLLLPIAFVVLVGGLGALLVWLS